LIVEPARPVADDSFVVRWNDVNWGSTSPGYSNRVAVIGDLGDESEDEAEEQI
jgi:hypothetical protein